MADNAPKSGSNHPAPKRVHGRGWLKQRVRNGKTWRQRKLASTRYCRGGKF